MPSDIQNPLWGYDKRYASTTTFLSTTTILKDFWFIDNTLCHYKVWYNWLRERKDNYDFILRFSTKTNQSETTTNRNSTYFNYKTRKVDKLFELINWFYNNYMIQKQWFGIFFLNQDEESLAKQFLWQRFKPKYLRGFMMSRKLQIDKNLGFYGRFMVLCWLNIKTLKAKVLVNINDW